jgi:hypothetical protein
VGSARIGQTSASGEEAPAPDGTEFEPRNAGGGRVGRNVVVIGNGDTAIDAAWVRRGLGAQVTIVTDAPTEMPAIARDREALERVKSSFPRLPGGSGTAESRDGRPARLGKPDASDGGPVPSRDYECRRDDHLGEPQEPDSPLGTRARQGLVREWGRRRAGDMDRRQHPGLGLAPSVGQGRAANVHACWRAEGAQVRAVGPEKIKMDHYEAKARAVRASFLEAARKPEEIDGISKAMVDEAVVLLLRQVLRLREVLDVLPGRLLREGPGSAPRPLLQGQARGVRRLQEVR